MNSARPQSPSSPARLPESTGHCRVLCLACTGENILPALQALEAGGFVFECDFAADVEGLAALLKKPELWQVALIRQCGEDSLKIEVAMAMLTGQTPDTPLVVLLDNPDEAIACKLIAQGVCDVLEASRFSRLPGIVKREAIRRQQHSSVEPLPGQPLLDARREISLRDAGFAKECLSAYRNNFLQMADFNMFGLLFWKLSGEMIEANNTLLRMIGYSQAEMEAGLIRWDTLIPPEYASLERQIAATLRHDKKQSAIEKQYIHKDGHRVDVLIGGILLEDSEEIALSFILDISQQKRVEQALRENEWRSAFACRIVQMGYWERDFQTGEMRWSTEMDRLFGFVEANFDGTFADFLNRFVHMEDRDRVAEYSHRLVMEWQEFDFDYRIIRPDGQIRTVNAQAGILRDKQGRPNKVVGTVLDITERKQTEDALRQSQQLLMATQHIARLGYWVRDIERNTFEYSDEMDRIYGFREGHFDNTYADFMARFVHPDDRELVAEHSRLMNEEGRPFHFDHRITHPNGQTRTLNVQAHAEFNAEGRPVRVIGTAQDITERKEAENALKESENRLLKAQQLAHLGYWDWDIADNRLYWSDYVYEIFGLPRDEFEVNHEAMMGRFHPDDRARVSQRLLEFLDNPEQGLDLSFRIMRPDGQIRYVYSQGEMTLDGAGKPIRMSGTHQDVTDLMQAKMALEDSLRFHRAVLDALSMHIAILDEQGTVLDVNQAWRDFGIRYGLDPDVILGSNYFAACRSDADYAIYAKQALSGMAQVLGGKQEVFSLDYPCEAGGQRFWFRLNVTRFQSRDAHGTPFMRLVLSHEDISHRRLADEALGVLISQNEALLNNIPDFAWMKDVEGRYIAMNAPCARLLNRPKEETIGKTDFDLWPQPMAFKLRTDDRFVLRTGQRILVESAMDLPDETQLWLETINCPIRNSEGVIIGTVGIARDITNRKEAENIIIQSHEALERMVEERTVELQDANRSLKENEQLRTNFVSALAHDLRTPLIAQRRLIELLEDQFSGLGGKAAFLAHGLVQNNENLLDMVNKLLETYQYDEGRIEPHWEVCNLHHLVEDCYDTVRSMAAEKHIKLINGIPMHFPPLVADPSLLRRVFINLLGNALENIASGCHIRIDANTEGDLIVIRVEDNGCGIDPGILPGVFERYFTHSRTRQKIGSGLGLFICKMIVDLHGGMIAVESELGKGTLFTIKLPHRSLSDLPVEHPSPVTTDVALETEPNQRPTTMQNE